MIEDKTEKLIQDLGKFLSNDEYTELDKVLVRVIVALRSKQND
jgi:hypothetical protein